MCKDSDSCKNPKNAISSELREYGFKCGDEIATIAKEMHPNALIVIPLYRSCIVIEQSEEEKKEGSCTMHSYADPHWLGGEIDVDTLKTDDFHFEYSIQGDRQRPIIIDKTFDNKETKDIDEEPIVIEYDEN